MVSVLLGNIGSRHVDANTYHQPEHCCRQLTSLHSSLPDGRGPDGPSNIGKHVQEWFEEHESSSQTLPPDSPDLNLRNILNKP